MLKARTMLLAGLLTLGGSVYAQSVLRTTDFVPYIPPPGSGFELFLSVQHQSALQDMPEQTTTTVTAYTDDGVEIASRDFVLNRGERTFGHDAGSLHGGDARCQGMGQGDVIGRIL